MRRLLRDNHEDAALPAAADAPGRRAAPGAAGRRGGGAGASRPRRTAAGSGWSRGCSSTSRSTSRCRRTPWPSSTPSTPRLRRTPSTWSRSIEATLEDPRPVLGAQEHKARGEAIGEMKADGIEYDERMELLDEVTWPKPLEELLEHTYALYRQRHPWVGRGRALAEVGGARHVRARDDLRGVRRLLRPHPLRGAGAALPRRRLPRAAADRAGAACAPTSSRTSSSGSARSCARPTRACSTSGSSSTTPTGWPREAAPDVLPPTPERITANERAFTVLVRNAMFRRVELAALNRLGAAR